MAGLSDVVSASWHSGLGIIWTFRLWAVGSDRMMIATIHAVSSIGETLRSIFDKIVVP